MKFPFRVTLPEDVVNDVIRMALSEDAGGGDVTTEATVGSRARGRARLTLKDDGVVAGLEVFRAVFAAFDPRVKVMLKSREGRFYRRGRNLAEVEGRIRSILTCERVALNLLQRLSGIATLTHRFVEQVKGTGVKIVDTRKTTPGLRLLEKYAVLTGGGFNHRFTLSDLALIKDNHIKAAGGIEQAVRRVRRAGGGVPVEIEVGPETDPSDLRGLDVDIVMLDNWPVSDLKRAIKVIKGFPSRPLIEVSGGIGLDGVRKIAMCGPDVISVGSLTHSAPSLDISLDLKGRALNG
ncbi:MAG: carboxylating nicotinate-nucleotide diphosphorylase [Candidatus Eisenbacteria bacterium]